jgi:hypothetical protein
MGQWDLYSFEPKAVVKTDPFIDIVARHFKQPVEGLGSDNSPSAHRRRTIANPDLPLWRDICAKRARLSVIQRWTIGIHFGRDRGRIRSFHRI